MQPFGGEGLSGTGPKAGGPHYLVRFCAEQTVTVNTTAAGAMRLCWRTDVSVFRHGDRTMGGLRQVGLQLRDWQRF